MGRTAQLPMPADRYGALVRTVRIIGLDLTGKAQRLQVRLVADTPGPPLVDLQSVTSASAQGLWLKGVTADELGRPVSTVVIRINETTLEGLPYSGELGDATHFAYDWQVTLSGDKRRIAAGPFMLLPGVTGADNASVNRVMGYGARSSGADTWAAATLTFGDETVEIAIDGVDIIAGYEAQADQHRAASLAAADDSATSATLADQKADDASLSAATALAASARYPTTAAGIAAVAEGAYFLVPGAGNSAGRLYRKVSGTAQDTGVDVPSLAAVQASSDLATYVAGIRPVLRRAFERPLLPMARDSRDLARRIVNGARATTTNEYDQLAARTVWLPDGGGHYTSSWTRDQAMAMQQCPDLFPSGEIAGVYQWIKAKVRPHPVYPVELGLEVPDHTDLTGFPHYHPGATDSDPGSGNRAPVDGNAFLHTIAWAHYVKTGSPSLYVTDKDFLWSLLEQVPYDPVTKCVTISSASDKWSLPWGFVEAVRVSGSVCMATVLMFEAYRQHADMAFAAGDFARARQAVARAEEIKAGFNATLWIGVSAGTVEKGWFKVATGTCSGSFDVWGSARACYAGLATPEHAAAISHALADAWAVATNGKPELYLAGAVRHVPRSNDYAVGTKALEGARNDVFAYDAYQNGGYWHTATAWVCYALGLTTPALATKLAAAAIGEAARQSWVLRAAHPGDDPSPFEWIAVSTDGQSVTYPTTNNQPSGAFVSAIMYVTSATALLTISALDCAEFAGIQSTLIPDAPFAANIFPVGVDANIPMRLVRRDELAACNTSAPNFILPWTGRWRLGAAVRFDAQSNTPGEIILRANIEGTPVKPLRDMVFPAGAAFSIDGSSDFDATRGQQINASIYVGGNPISPQVPGGLPAELFNYITLTYLGPAPFQFQ